MEINKQEVERVTFNVAEEIRKQMLPGGMIFKQLKGVGGSGWRIKKEGIATIQSNNFTPSPEVEMLEKLREVLRVPEGENIVTHARVVRALADALIGLQK